MQIRKLCGSSLTQEEYFRLQDKPDKSLLYLHKHLPKPYTLSWNISWSCGKLQTNQLRAIFAKILEKINQAVSKYLNTYRARAQFKKYFWQYQIVNNKCQQMHLPTPDFAFIKFGFHPKLGWGCHRKSSSKTKTIGSQQLPDLKAGNQEKKGLNSILRDKASNT